MEPVYLFGLINQQRSWLSTRQEVIARNVANANTPGFKTLDLKPFVSAPESGELGMVATGALHLSSATEGELSVNQMSGEAWETTQSGNSVSLESEMIKAGDVRTAYSLNASIMKAFHGMWISSLKG
ncbi:MAG: flagellar basal body protein [Methylocystis sp.]|jgi:flagellar basal-body rod protein FlgB